MFFFKRKHASKLIAAAVAVSTMASISAAALDQPVATLSSNLNASVGNVLTTPSRLWPSPRLRQKPRKRPRPLPRIRPLHRLLTTTC